MKPRRAALFLLLAGVLTGPAAGSAQSLFSAGGLGAPLEPLGARVRGMGGVGVAPLQADILPTNPALARGLAVPTASFTTQSVWGSIDLDGAESDLEATRFPLLALAYPVGSWGTLTLTYGGYLDQRWSAEEEGSVVIGGSTVGVVDDFESDGGISTLRLGWAVPLGENLSVGVSGGLHTGRSVRSLERRFEPFATGDTADVLRVEGRWNYMAPTASAGVLWEPFPVLTVGGSLTWSGELSADAEAVSRGFEIESRDFDLPLETRLEASGLLTPDLGVTLGVSYADWSGTGRSLKPGTVADPAWTVGGGVEWGGGSLLGRSFPLRLGYRRAELPFAPTGGDPVESVVTGGFGLGLAESQEVSLARLDMGLERGRRIGGALAESFWRATLTLRLGGN